MGRLRGAVKVAAAGGALAVGQALAQPGLTPVERRWLDGGAPVLAEARRLGLPLDVVVQPQPNAGEPPLAMAWLGGRCKLVMTMRGPGGAPLPPSEVDPALPAVLVEAMFAHELAHCWRHANGAWHAAPAGFSARRGGADGPSSAGPAGDPDGSVAAARREEGFADLVALAWTLRRDPAAYRRVHDWLSAERAAPAHDGAEHDTRAWISAASDPRAFPPGEPVWRQADAVWRRVIGAD